MYRKTIQFILMLLVCTAWSKETEKTVVPVALKDAPAEIVHFFESGRWVAVIDSVLNTKSNATLSDFDMLPPNFNRKRYQADEPDVCRVSMYNKKMRISFRFQKKLDGWQYDILSIIPVKEHKMPKPRDGKHVAKKPIIYLYPQTKMNIQIQLDFEEKLTYCYPPYPEKGWNVTAFPDGTLQRYSDNKKFYALFWEGQMDSEYPIEEGFVVAADSIESFLEEKLSLIGLNFREQQEFIIYWAPLMKKNPYSLIHFSIEEYIKEFPLEVTPKPDSEIRVNMLFKACDVKTTIRPQVLKPGKREGFTLVEWGGTDLDAKSMTVQ